MTTCGLGWSRLSIRLTMPLEAVGGVADDELVGALVDDHRAAVGEDEALRACSSALTVGGLGVGERLGDRAHRLAAFSASLRNAAAWLFSCVSLSILATRSTLFSTM